MYKVIKVSDIILKPSTIFEVWFSCLAIQLFWFWSQCLQVKRKQILTRKQEWKQPVICSTGCGWVIALITSRKAYQLCWWMSYWTRRQKIWTICTSFPHQSHQLAAVWRADRNFFWPFFPRFIAVRFSTIFRFLDSQTKKMSCCTVAVTSVAASQILSLSGNLKKIQISNFQICELWNFDVLNLYRLSRSCMRTRECCAIITNTADALH